MSDYVGVWAVSCADGAVYVADEFGVAECSISGNVSEAVCESAATALVQDASCYASDYGVYSGAGFVASGLSE